MRKTNADAIHAHDVQRRRLAFGLASSALTFCTPVCVAQAQSQLQATSDTEPAGPTKEEWLDQYFGQKAFGPPLGVSRFLDRTYYLIRDLWWEATGTSAPLGRISVPKGFVTDFASIPRIFWAILPPDDEYVTAAIIHDWLYWNQSTTRQQADQALKDSMTELGIGSFKGWAIYQGVEKAGTSAWNENARIKQQGEKRVLKEFPSDLKVKWAEWKVRPGVFY